MKVNAALGIALGLALTQPALSGAQEPKAAIKPAAPDPAAARTKAVDALVAQLRKYPARPSRAAEATGLFLIDANGGEATLIASEPEPWLNHCAWPAWSPDGTTIALSASRLELSHRASRIKMLNLHDGRLAMSDLGAGGWPTFAPSGDRVMALLDRHLPENHGLETGLWIMGIDGSNRACIGGGDRPRWSPRVDQYLTAREGPASATIVSVQADKSGELKMQDGRLTSPPSWAGEDLIVATIATQAGESVALIDVANPCEAVVREILWLRRDGSEASPGSPIYSKDTGRTVFVGSFERKGSALYTVTRGKPDRALRLENRGLDDSIEDLAFSPDGRYVLFCSNRKLGGQTPRLRAQSVSAPVLQGITIDGDLGDWPAAIPRHAVCNLYDDPSGKSSLDHAHPALSTSRDLSAAFSVGYDLREQLLYVAVVVRDDELVLGHANWADTDSVNVYVDGRRSEEIVRWGNRPDWEREWAASELPVLWYAGIPGAAPVYGDADRPEDERAVANPILFHGDVNKTKTRMAFRRHGDVTTYEWAVQAFDRYPDKPTKLVPAARIGFDVVVRDKDVLNKPNVAGPRSESSSRLCWASRPRTWYKVMDPASLGEVVLGRPPAR